MLQPSDIVNPADLDALKVISKFLSACASVMFVIVSFPYEIMLMSSNFKINNIKRSALLWFE